MNTDLEDLWLAEFVVKSDILIMDIIEVPYGTQETVGRIRHCYTSMYKTPAKYDLGDLRFITGTGSWGNANPENGETVLIAVTYRPTTAPDAGLRIYEKHWHGHFAIQTLEGQLCAIAKYPIQNNPRVPQTIRDAVRGVPGAPMFSAFPFVMLEDYLMDLIPKINNVQPVRSQLADGGRTSV